MDCRAALACAWALRALGCALLVLACVRVADAQIPSEAAKYRRELLRNARLIWGLDAPTATFAAQIHQESTWRPDARSHVGAGGLAQFMPATAEWIGGVYAHLGERDPFNPSWAIRALVQYDRHLYDFFAGLTHCERMAKALSGYNGGPGWVVKDERLARSRGLDAAYWFDGVETVNSGRSAANFHENRTYVRRILHELEPRYRAAGWGIYSC